MTSKVQTFQSCSAKLSADKKSGTKRSLSYLLRMLVAVTLPISDPQSDKVTRSNGRYTLTIATSSDRKLPWGIYPRLIMIWLCTQAVLTRSRTLRLGKSYGKFVTAVCGNSKASSYQRKQVKEQLHRLLATSFTATESTKEHESAESIHIASKWDLWKVEKRRERGFIILTQEFYDLIVQSPIPFDTAAIKSIGSSAFLLDVFMWVSWRVPRIKSGTESKLIPYDDLMEQFGTMQQRTCDFKREFLAALKMVRNLWPELDFKDMGKGIVLVHAQPFVPRRPPSNTDVYEQDTDDDDPFR